MQNQDAVFRQCFEKCSHFFKFHADDFRVVIRIRPHFKTGTFKNTFMVVPSRVADIGFRFREPTVQKSHRLSTPPNRPKSVWLQRALLPAPDYPAQTANAGPRFGKCPNLPLADKERVAVQPHALLLPGGQIPKPAFCLRHQNKCLCSN